jgi:cyclopropane fatty-acyl-phospholipid synthase-like methyltransferase
MREDAAHKVKAYYDRTTRKYLDIYGEVIQAFRPRREKDLLDYLAKSSGLKWKTRILDAGCGVCGPARYFARQYHSAVDAITLSDVQAAEADTRNREAGLQDRIRVVCGDYHQLTRHFQAGIYDAVYFLESLGHSDDPATALREAYALLKPGGYIYIKDFYRRQVDDAAEQEKIDRVIANMDRHYAYHTPDLLTVIGALRACGFLVEFIKRFDFRDDTTVRAAFETDQHIDIFEGMPEFAPAEWLEIKCIKP